jgi:hypothetical protein
MVRTGKDLATHGSIGKEGQEVMLPTSYPFYGGNRDGNGVDMQDLWYTKRLWVRLQMLIVIRPSAPH